jgi:hypothetical protein
MFAVTALTITAFSMLAACTVIFNDSGTVSIEDSARTQSGLIVIDKLEEEEKE